MHASSGSCKGCIGVEGCDPTQVWELPGSGLALVRCPAKVAVAAGAATGPPTSVPALANTVPLRFRVRRMA